MSRGLKSFLGWSRGPIATGRGWQPKGLRGLGSRGLQIGAMGSDVDHSVD